MKMNNNRIFTLIVFFEMSLMSFCQVKTQMFNGNGHLFDEISIPLSNVTLPAMDIQELISERTAENDTTLYSRFGKAYDQSFSMQDGKWMEFGDGKIWSISFFASCAQSLNFVFSNVSLSDGAELYITNNDKSFVFGPVVSADIPDSGIILSDIVPDSVAHIILYEPNGLGRVSSFQITKVIYGYRNISQQSSERSYTIICDIACLPEYDYYADGMGFLLTADGEHYCSGALVMTTDYSFKPYFLTSIKGATGGSIYLNDTNRYNIENGMYKFHKRKTTCSGNALTTSISYYGASAKAYHPGSGFLLTEIAHNLKSNTSLTWLGWDRSGITPQSEAFIFHTSDGVEKVFSSDNTMTTGSFTPTIHYWELKSGDTYSYGSTLLNPNCRLIGQLINTSYNAGSLYSIFYKFCDAWHWNDDPNLNLFCWLDSLGTNQMLMDAYKPLVLNGPIIPCGNELYEIPDFPDGYTVDWSFCSGYNNSLINTSYLDEGQCLLCNTNYEHINDTLRAQVKKNGIILQTLKKKIFTGAGFSGHVLGIRLANTLVPYLGLIDGGLYTGLAGTSFTIYSSALNGCDVYYSNNFQQHVIGDSIKLFLPYNNGGYSTHVNIINHANCLYFRMEISVEPNSPVLLTTEGKYYTVSLKEEALSIDDSDGPWSISVYNSDSGSYIFRESLSSTPVTINTNNWASGVYILRVEKGENVATYKLSI